MFPMNLWQRHKGVCDSFSICNTSEHVSATCGIVFHNDVAYCAFSHTHLETVSRLLAVIFVGTVNGSHSCHTCMHLQDICHYTSVFIAMMFCCRLLQLVKTCRKLCLLIKSKFTETSLDAKCKAMQNP